MTQIPPDVKPLDGHERVGVSTMAEGQGSNQCTLSGTKVLTLEHSMLVPGHPPLADTTKESNNGRPE